MMIKAHMKTVWTQSKKACGEHSRHELCNHTSRKAEDTEHKRIAAGLLPFVIAIPNVILVARHCEEKKCQARDVHEDAKDESAIGEALPDGLCARFSFNPLKIAAI